MAVQQTPAYVEKIWDCLVGAAHELPTLYVENQADAQVFIDRQKQIAKGQPVRFLILFPRELSGFPTQPQVDNYRAWFEQRKAAYTFDNPWAAK